MDKDEVGKGAGHDSLLSGGQAVEGQLGSAWAVTAEIRTEDTAENGFESRFPAALAVRKSVAPDFVDVAVEDGDAAGIGIGAILHRDQKMLEPAIGLCFGILAKKDREFRLTKEERHIRLQTVEKTPPSSLPPERAIVKKADLNRVYALQARF